MRSRSPPSLMRRIWLSVTFSNDAAARRPSGATGAWGEAAQLATHSACAGAAKATLPNATRIAMPALPGMRIYLSLAAAPNPWSGP